MKPELISNWQDCWRWFSVQANSIGIAISSTYAIMYDQLKETIPANYMAAATAIVFLLGIIGRIANQTKVEK